VVNLHTVVLTVGALTAVLLHQIKELARSVVGVDLHVAEDLPSQRLLTLPQLLRCKLLFIRTLDDLEFLLAVFSHLGSFPDNRFAEEVVDSRVAINRLRHGCFLAFSADHDAVGNAVQQKS